MAKQTKSSTRIIPVEFGADQDYLISGITKDVTTLECIYDLVDNSIDAARNDLLAKRGTKFDHYGLPASYSGYEIRISFSSSLFVISDNCSGMSEENLTSRSFITGARSNHPFGIGTFGVGLNRAVFRLGKSTSLSTDNGDSYLTLSFTEDDIRNGKGKGIFANASKSKGKKFYRVQISDFQPGIVQEFSSKSWQDSMCRGVRERYGLFVKKGLKIFIDDVPIPAFDKGIGESVFFPPLLERKDLAEGVQFFLEAGFHEKYDVTPGAGPSGKNKNLAEDYGWYVVCNDRIILVADRSKLTGWKQWHPEYNGFVGWVYYVSKNPDSLPWDSKKTGINTHSAAYVSTLSILTKSAQKFRTANRRRLKQKKVEGDPRNAPSKRSSNSSTAPATASSENTGSPEENSKRHTSDLKEVFVVCNVKSNRPKIAALVIEASNTQISGAPYRAAIMLRTLVEHALRDYIARHRHFSAMKAASIVKAESNLGRALREDEKKNRRVDFDFVLAWSILNPDIFPEGSDRSACKRSLTEYQKHLKKLNGVVHEIGEIIDESKVIEMRNNVITALVILLEY